jgi:hypothetical protein
LGQASVHVEERLTTIPVGFFGSREASDIRNGGKSGPDVTSPCFSPQPDGFWTLGKADGRREAIGFIHES